MVTFLKGAVTSSVICHCQVVPGAGRHTSAAFPVFPVFVLFVAGVLSAFADALAGVTGVSVIVAATRTAAHEAHPDRAGRPLCVLIARAPVHRGRGRRPLFPLVWIRIRTGRAPGRPSSRASARSAGGAASGGPVAPHATAGAVPAVLITTKVAAAGTLQGTYAAIMINHYSPPRFASAVLLRLWCHGSAGDRFRSPGTG
ncbi:hypothetical protein GCM10017559_03400 [Streptosporangium longisporum]|uniref:Uncharacterized protein n=1 Tax=Streptosporangium longisporum TaxID=46187 RepID=A0ABN3XS13_9ACTN